MLLRINDKIINTAYIVSATFTSAVSNQKEQLYISFVNNTDPMRPMLLQGDAAVLVWGVLCQEAPNLAPKS
jgi:hypothetical protein